MSNLSAFGNSLIAKRKIYKGEIALEIPESLFISMGTCNSDQQFAILLAEFDKKNTLLPVSIFGLYLFYLSEQKEGFWYPYLSNLP